MKINYDQLDRAIDAATTVHEGDPRPVIGILNHPKWPERIEKWNQLISSVKQTGQSTIPIEEITKLDDEINADVPGASSGENCAAVIYSTWQSQAK